jgi:hypothetical protein
LTVSKLTRSSTRYEASGFEFVLLTEARAVHAEVAAVAEAWAQRCVRSWVASIGLQPPAWSAVIAAEHVILRHAYGRIC